jgi:hypothetical protein
MILGRGSNEDAGHERVCALTEEFWDIAESDEDRSELDRLLGIARQMGDGIDDDAEEEGFDDIAENATKAAIGASFADATGDTEVVFTAIDRLEVLCADLGLGGNASSEPVREVDAPSGEAPEAEVESMPRDRPAGIVIADESQALLPDDPFESLSCDLRERQTEGSGSAYYCVGTQVSGRTLEVNAFDDGSNIVWGFATGGPDCEGVSGCTYGNAIDQGRLRAEVASMARVDADAIDCDAGYWPGHRVPPGGRIGCEITSTGDVIEAKVLADDRYEITR